MGQEKYLTASTCFRKKRNFKLPKTRKGIKHTMFTDGK